ncbi:MAG TPA: nucleoid occlusion factor SlmA [Gallionellaceae bacterium]|nr:nucleoid occlusion factor SlmA [Gallionellaceae bacterium]
MAAKTGERKLQILQAIAEMLEQPKGEKITTAQLAARLELSEAALYRHFASKAQMFEGLIEFIEQTVFGLINKITAEEADGMKQAEGIVALLLGFARKNRGMTRVLTGDALVNEDQRLQARINQLLDRIETTLKQAVRIAVTQKELPEDTDAGARANVLLCYVIGRWQLFAKSGYARDPMEQWPQQWSILAR